MLVRLLLALAVGSVVAAPQAAALPTVPATGVFLQVVAHPDDDILFMNPDLRTALAAGLPATTVFLTAGEADRPPGSREPVSDTGCRNAGLSREQYADCRARGARAAWSAMAGRPNTWTRAALTVPDGTGWSRQVDVDTLAGAGPVVNLVWVNLPDWADVHDVKADPVNDLTGPDASLYHLWADGSVRRTITPAASARPGQTYGRADVLRLLSGLYQHFQPTVVRVQDVEPDARYRQNPAWLNDHSDHVIAARLATEAAAVTPRPRILGYRNYNLLDAQVNLEAAEQAGKQAVFDRYAAFDGLIGPNDPFYGGLVQREYQRWWTGTKWVDRNLDGRLQAFAVFHGRLRTWWQAPGGAWQGPVELADPGGPLAPGLSLARNQDGRLEVFALRLSDWAVVTTYQYEPNGGWVNRWDSLGNPNTGGGGPVSQIGQPVVTTNQDGRIQLFVKNGGGGISTTYQLANNSGFGGWVDLGGGPGIQDGLAATTNGHGEIEVFAYTVNAGIGAIHHIYQLAPNGGFATNPTFAEFEPAGPPTVATSADGTLDVFYRLASNNTAANAGRVAHTWQWEMAGGSTDTPEILDGDAGVGPVAAVSAPHPRDGYPAVADPRIVLLERNRTGTMSMTRQTVPNGGYFNPWTSTGPYSPTEPAMAIDASGRIFAFTLAGDGRLLVSHQTTPTGPAPFTDWEVI
ncbi:PIG-L family deacetylase [Actinophytocola sp.]|uniref:PIG-L family deacetylase n=1 Tax=Actinophytocola sp. TaxID=1872138 RepID=UPI002D7E230D|nr:PIG-L family deacetylase [Actinophytocola sp.]HET9143471.1 PIG-L family deacetylase [Actinophytocola sp.]